MGDPDSATALVPPPDGVIDQRFAIELSYPVVFTADLFAPDREHLAWAIRRQEPERRHRVFAVIDDGVAAAWPELAASIERWFAARAGALELVEAPRVVPGGERAKNDPALVDDLHRRFAAAHLDRHSCVLAIGGGAMLDAVGYAVATTHRGLRLVRAPSTVLAQNDAGIGVKNGINAFGTKNFLGTFAPPFAVLCDETLLSTLSDRDRRAGIAEAIKVSLVRDAAFFGWLAAHADDLARTEPAAMREMIRRCAELHLAHIRTSGDPFELGSARPLDFGHWSAHKLETMSDHDLRHGEAVAIGLALDVRYSEAAGRLPTAEADRIVDLLAAVGLPTWHEALDRRDPGGAPAVLVGLDEFREHLGGDLTITLLDAIGRGIEVNDVDAALVATCIERLRPAMPRGADATR